MAFHVLGQRSLAGEGLAAVRAGQPPSKRAIEVADNVLSQARIGSQLLLARATVDGAGVDA